MAPIARATAVLVALFAAVLVAAPGAWADQEAAVASGVSVEEALEGAAADDAAALAEGVPEGAASLDAVGEVPANETEPVAEPDEPVFVDEPDSATEPATEPQPAIEPQPAQEPDVPLPAEDAAAPAGGPAEAVPVEKPMAYQPAKPATPPKQVSAADSASTSQPADAAGTQTAPDAAADEDGDAARTVADGVYWIASYSTPKQAIAIANGAKKAGAAASLAAKAKGEAWQKWQFTWKDGSYEIVNVATGKALAVASGKAGAKVVQAKRANTAAQRWTIERSADGKYVVIRNVQSGAVVNISGKAKAGTGITTVAKARKAAQRFKLAKANLIDAGAFQLRTALNAKLAVSIPKAKKGAAATLAKRGKAMAQRLYIRNEAGGLYSIQSVSSGLFLAEKGGKAVFLPWSDSNKALLWNGAYASGVRFLNASTGKALAVADGKAAAKTVLVAADPASGKAQLWTYAAQPLLNGGTFALRNAAGGYLEVKGGSYKKGANIRTAADAAKNGSQCFELQEADGLYRLVNTRTYQAVAVKGNSKKSGANVVQQASGKSKGQLWKASINRDGSISFANARSGKVLQKGKSGNANQAAANGATGQGWMLDEVKRYSLSGNQKLDKTVATVLSTRSSLSSAFSYVVGFSYREGKRFYGGSHYLSDATTIGYANDMYSHHSGNCYRFASLFSWLARGLGYSTKVVSGWVPAATGGQAPHGWVEVKSGGSTYVCDPDLRHELPGHNWYMTTYAGAPITYGSW